MQKIQHYVLFPNHDNGMRLYGILKEAGIKATIAPTPRAASKCCGISLLVRKDDLEANGILIHGGTDIVKKLVLSEERIYELYWN